MNTNDKATTRFRVSLFNGDESFNHYYKAASRDEAVRLASRACPEFDINSCTQMAAGWLNVYHVGRAYGGPEEGGGGSEICDGHGVVHHDESEQPRGDGDVF